MESNDKIIEYCGIISDLSLENDRLTSTIVTAIAKLKSYDIKRAIEILEKTITIEEVNIESNKSTETTRLDNLEEVNDPSTNIKYTDTATT